MQKAYKTANKQIEIRLNELNLTHTAVRVAVRTCRAPCWLLKKEYLSLYLNWAIMHRSGLVNGRPRVPQLA